MKKKLHIELIHRIAVNGEESAFRKLYYDYYERLFRFGMHMVKSEEWCEEIVSDVFFNIWQNRQQLTEIDNLEAYLFKSVKNKCLHYLDKSARRPRNQDLSVSIEYTTIDENTPESIVLDNELNQLLQKAINSLPDRCRTIFKLVREDGMKYKQIAEILNISVRTIDAQMSIATQKIKAIIEKYK
ncbi:MAG: RNA polymerase sigma-70 factor [Bacteroidales bacterium]|nr:RNA polymerase sigma-70 factor [Bacteroidales bacterium]